MRWGIVYYASRDGSIPAIEYLDACPPKIAAHLVNILEVVRAAPPPAFSGGGKWEAMHGSMNGFYEARTSGPGRDQYRLFCILENAGKAELTKRGFGGPQIVVISGMTKASGELFSDSEYRKGVRALADDHRSNYPRRIAEP